MRRRHADNRTVQVEEQLVGHDRGQLSAPSAQPRVLFDGDEMASPAHRVSHPAELHRLQEDATIWPWPGGEREVYVRIVPSQITGRRIEIR